MAGKKPARPLTVGRKIKKARTDKKLTLDTLANETGLAVDYLRRIESGKEIPPVGTLLQVSKALEINSADLLREPDSKLRQRIRAYTKRTENYAYATLTPGAENKHLKAFSVNVEAGQDHKGVGYQHEGEEFVHVLAGQIDITVGEHTNHLEAGDSLHFNSGIRHRMRNPGGVRTELIVVIYQP